MGGLSLSKVREIGTWSELNWVCFCQVVSCARWAEIEVKSVLNSNWNTVGKVTGTLQLVTTVHTTRQRHARATPLTSGNELPVNLLAAEASLFANEVDTHARTHVHSAHRCSSVVHNSAA